MPCTPTTAVAKYGSQSACNPGRAHGLDTALQAALAVAYEVATTVGGPRPGPDARPRSMSSGLPTAMSVPPTSHPVTSPPAEAASVRADNASMSCSAWALFRSSDSSGNPPPELTTVVRCSQNPGSDKRTTGSEAFGTPRAPVCRVTPMPTRRSRSSTAAGSRTAFRARTTTVGGPTSPLNIAPSATADSKPKAASSSKELSAIRNSCSAGHAASRCSAAAAPRPRHAASSHRRSVSAPSSSRQAANSAAP
mmetsp:Transcript_87176/g.222081  ORF Transcript_87176/g.222081 Transcript_87176/m.222081 type:complete len:251 (+) Transcript_87176:945-1697(+)